MLDTDRKGHITVNDIRRHFLEHNNKIDERLLHELLKEVDLNKNGELELSEFFQASDSKNTKPTLKLQLCSGLKGGQITQNRLVRYLDELASTGFPSVHYSGGGV